MVAENPDFRRSADQEPVESYVPVDIPELDDKFDSETLKYLGAFTGAAMLAAISVIAIKRLKDKETGA